MQESAITPLEKIPETRKTTRRVFLSAASAAAMTAASYVRVLGANDRIGIGVIGFGLIGKQHITDLKKFKDVDLLGMCDCYKPRLDESLAYIGNPDTKGFGDFRKMKKSLETQQTPFTPNLVIQTGSPCLQTLDVCRLSHAADSTSPMLERSLTKQ